MTDWRSCDNCKSFVDPLWCACIRCKDNEGHIDFSMWEPIHCRCGGALSEIRERKDKNGKVIKRYRHCYSCHFEFEEA